MPKVRLRKAVQSDIGFMMLTERQPGFEWKVGRWDEPRHRLMLADPANEMLVGLDAQNRPCGFAILRRLEDTEQNLYLQRIAMAAPGTGLGQPMLRALLDWVFGQTDTHRLWLLVKDGNDRARHVYAACGFIQEGRLREAFVNPLGDRCDAYQLSILRSEWPSSAASATT